mmetsp:Transcript_35814/g.89125  ORF Transcript_35814/g.89125 Transcript_35814/m.89125 type:complete len:202 (-) Transcript_35814:618-1223(-)
MEGSVYDTHVLRTVLYFVRSNPASGQSPHILPTLQIVLLPLLFPTVPSTYEPTYAACLVAWCCLWLILVTRAHLPLSSASRCPHTRPLQTPHSASIKHAPEGYASHAVLPRCPPPPPPLSIYSNATVRSSCSPSCPQPPRRTCSTWLPACEGASPACSSLPSASAAPSSRCPAASLPPLASPPLCAALPATAGPPPPPPPL